MVKVRVVRFDASTREGAIKKRRELIANVNESDREEAKGYALPPELQAIRAGYIKEIRALERRWNLTYWDRQKAMATTRKEAIQEANMPFDIAAAVLMPRGPSTARKRVIIQDAGGLVAVVTTAARMPLLPGLVEAGARPAEFFEAMRQADELRDDAGHDVRGALLTISGQVSTAPPQGQDAFLIYCRNCRKGAWFLPPVSMDAATIARARIAQLGGACEGPGRPPTPPAPPDETR